MSTSFDSDSVYQRLITRLSSKASWSDILLQGTNSRLIKAIAEEFAYSAQYDNYVTRENKWSLARNRSSLISSQEVQRYLAHRKIGSFGLLKVSSSSTFNTPPIKNIIIPKFTIFSTQDNIKFSSTQNEVITTTDDYRYIDIVQGIPRTFTQTASGLTNEEFILLNNNIENSIFELRVNNIIWDNVENLLSYNSTDQVFEIENKIDFSGIILKFGNDIYGKKLSLGDIVEFKWIETTGGSGNILSSNLITKVDSSIYDIDNNKVTIYCTNDSTILGGSDEEDIESIRYNAPRIFQTGDRATTKEDYEVIIKSFNYISKVGIWGAYETNIDNGDNPWTFIPSEENVVHIAALTSTYEALSTAQKLSITQSLNPKKSLTDILQFENVEIIPLIFNVSAYVSNRNYTLSQVKTNIENGLISEYGIANMEFFKHVYYSDYQCFIDSIEGVDHHDTTIEFYKDFTFIQAYTTDLTLPLYRIKPTSIRIYAQDTTIPSNPFILIGYDDGSNNLVGEVGYNLSASSINYDNGLGYLTVSGGLTQPFANYKIRIYYSNYNNNLILRKRYNIFGFSDSLSTINVNYF